MTLLATTSCNVSFPSTRALPRSRSTPTTLALPIPNRLSVSFHVSRTHFWPHASLLSSRVECHPRYSVTAAPARMWSSVIWFRIRCVIEYFLTPCMIYRPLISPSLILLATSAHAPSHRHLSIFLSFVVHSPSSLLLLYTLLTRLRTGPLGLQRLFP